MPTSATARRPHGMDLLARPPSGVRVPEDAWGALLIDPVAQLGELGDLVGRGLLSRDEFEAQKARILGSGTSVPAPVPQRRGVR